MQTIWQVKESRAARRLALIVLGITAAGLVGVPTGVAQTARAPRDRLVVSTGWVATHLHDRDLVLLQVGDSVDFVQAHIGGARPVTLAQVSSGMSGTTDMDHGLMLEMLPLDTLRERLEALGISTKSHVVVYSAKDRISTTTRVLYTLRYAGLSETSAMMDGGLPAWVAEGKPVMGGLPDQVAAGTIHAHPDPSLVVSAAWVAAHAKQPGIALLDARQTAFYDGTGQDDGPRRGHIPGAQSLPFEDLYDSQARLRSAAELTARFRQAGVTPGDTVVAYCHIGQRATAVLFAAATLGYPVRLYDGSFQEWGRRSDLPVENPAARPGGTQ